MTHHNSYYASNSTNYYAQAASNANYTNGSPFSTNNYLQNFYSNENNTATQLSSTPLKTSSPLIC
jgi:hypothetical protein